MTLVPRSPTLAERCQSYSAPARQDALAELRPRVTRSQVGDVLYAYTRAVYGPGSVDWIEYVPEP